MAKASLTFDLNDTEDAEMYAMHNQAKNLTLLVWEFLNHDLRTMYKHNAMPNYVNKTTMEDVWFKGEDNEFIPSNLTGLQMLELIRLMLLRKLEEEKIDLDVLS